VLYESALGIGIALGPLIGGLLGNVSWRGPFFGVSVLMAVALVATIVFLPKTARPTHRQKLSEPLAALKHRSLRITSIVGLLYNWAFFTLLGYSPFLMGIDSPSSSGSCSAAGASSSPCLPYSVRRGYSAGSVRPARCT
jgi:ACDE family multidrug resistance protein